MSTVCVAGVGAVGATIAARLAACGAAVSLLARGARLEQLRRDGLRVDFAGELIEARPPVSHSPDFGVQDLVFVAAKAHALPDLLPTLGPLIGPDTLVVPLVNGIPWWYFQRSGGPFDAGRVTAVDPHGVLRGAVDAHHLIGCVVYMTAQLQPSGLVSVMGSQRLIVGELAHGVGEPAHGVGELPHGLSQRASALASLLTRAGLSATASERIRDDLWTKVALNLATNPLSVVTEATLRDQFTDPKLMPIVAAVIEETARVAHGHQAQFALSTEEMMATGRRAGPFETSMLQDYRAGRRLELDAIAGSVLELAEKIGLQMPITKTIVELCDHRAARRIDAEK